MWAQGAGVVIAFTIAGGQIVGSDMRSDPERLSGLALTFDS